MDSSSYFEDFQRTGGLTSRKLREYIPAMMLTNLSVLLLISVDGLVVGNFEGTDALSSVNIFYPIMMLTGAVSTLVGSGIATSLSTSMGRNDPDNIDRVRALSLRIMIIMAVFVGIFQIPVVWLVIRSYGLSDEMYALTWQYAIGMMICMPISLINNVGTFQLQIAGKMKVLMRLTVAEGLSNLVFDLLFVGALHMGVAGAGYGSACANVIRAVACVYYLSHYTDLYKGSAKRIKTADFIEVLSCGGPDAVYEVIIAFQTYFIMRILLTAFGADAGAIKGVCSFCFNLTNVLISGIVGGMRPLTGLLAGAEDKKGLSLLMQQGFRLNLITATLAMLIIELVPGFFYTLHGVREVPDGGLLSVRLYALFFVFKGFDYLLRMYMSNRKDAKFATTLTALGNATLPLFAFAISRIAPPPFIFLAYLATELLVFSISFARYRWWMGKDREELEKSEETVLYMEVRPDQAVEASRQLRNFAEEKGIDRKIAYRAALCMEEMVAYAELTEASDAIEVMIRFIGTDKAVFVTLDDGKCIALDADEESQELITDNYGLLKKVARSVEYQYLLNMNYTRFTF